ncbi:MAG: succinylglutamate desuccinylase/aspartoacylase family protein [Immundisolibacterales bacterium]|nr:succinylglutamate desuccinylase/aspartoacylase family protein [Immundisolibacterales bacterium]
MHAQATIRDETAGAVPAEGFEMPAEPVEIEPPDLSPWRRGNAGVDYVHTMTCDRPGPHVMVSAIVHGNELCGAIVLDELLRAGVRPSSGRLTLAFMNVAAYERFDPEHPVLSRYVDEDFNRLWAREVLESRRDSVELRRARALRPVLDGVDFLLDLHSMQYSSAPLALSGAARKGRDFARALGLSAHIVRDAGHAAGPRMRDYAAFADAASPRAALLLECGQHWKRETVARARRAALRFLDHFGVELPEPPPPPDGAAARLIEVTEPITVRSHRFRFTAPYRGMEIIDKAGTVIGFDGDTAVATPYDECVLVMPSHRASRGTTAVRLGRFVG